MQFELYRSIELCGINRIVVTTIGFGQGAIVGNLFTAKQSNSHQEQKK
jgi:hypothetical protein